jgi:hypothetical protein
MVRFAIAVALFGACSKSSNCDSLRDKYIAWTEGKIKVKLGELEAGSDKDEAVARGNKELAQAKDRFVTVCKQFDQAIDATCFEDEATHDQDHKRRCREFLELFDHELYR